MGSTKVEFRIENGTPTFTTVNGDDIAVIARSETSGWQQVDRFERHGATVSFSADAIIEADSSTGGATVERRGQPPSRLTEERVKIEAFSVDAEGVTHACVGQSDGHLAYLTSKAPTLEPLAVKHRDGSCQLIVIAGAVTIAFQDDSGLVVMRSRASGWSRDELTRKQNVTGFDLVASEGAPRIAYTVDQTLLVTNPDKNEWRTQRIDVPAAWMSDVRLVSTRDGGFMIAYSIGDEKQPSTKRIWVVDSRTPSPELAATVLSREPFYFALDDHDEPHLLAITKLEDREKFVYLRHRRSDEAPRNASNEFALDYPALRDGCAATFEFAAGNAAVLALKPYTKHASDCSAVADLLARPETIARFDRECASGVRTACIDAALVRLDKLDIGPQAIELHGTPCKVARGCVTSNRTSSVGWRWASKAAPHDDARAIELLQRACALGSVSACFEIVVTSAPPRGPRDPAVYRATCRDEFAFGCVALVDALAETRTPEKDPGYALARGVLARACQPGVGHASECNALALLEEWNLGATSKGDPVAHYRLACADGSKLACTRLIELRAPAPTHVAPENLEALLVCQDDGLQCLASARARETGWGGIPKDSAGARAMLEDACNRGVKETCAKKK